jgi:DNA replicative helicase MCM subunit Mcm2 (Cdc46/Mcm family)
MSRFDLFFILQDDCNEAVDKDIAQHLVRLHQRKQEAVTPPISKEELQRYFNNKLTKHLQPAFIFIYLGISTTPRIMFTLN